MASRNLFEYEEHFVAFIDFLGFAAAIADADDEARTRLLTLLVNLSEAQSEFVVETRATPDGVATEVAPNITTFSDNIVISYPLEKLRAQGYYDEARSPAFILDSFSKLLSWLAIAALRIGFLIRGGATIGRLYHSRGVVYGEGMVEAYRIESQVANYPRVVLSDSVVSKTDWANHSKVLTDADGLKHVDYFKGLFLEMVVAPDGHSPSPGELIKTASEVMASRLRALHMKNQRAYSKWVWFCHQIQDGIDRVDPAVRKRFGLSREDIPMP